MSTFAVGTATPALPDHHRWAVLAVGTLGVFAALGLARFGYATVLRAMQQDLGFDNTAAGGLAKAALVERPGLDAALGPPGTGEPEGGPAVVHTVQADDDSPGLAVGRPAGQRQARAIVHDERLSFNRGPGEPGRRGQGRLNGGRGAG